MKRISFASTCAVAVLTTIALSSAASAGDFYLSGKLGITNLDHTIERDTGGFVLPVPDVGSVSTAQDTNGSLTLGLGYEQDFANGDFFWGVEGFIGLENTIAKNVNGVLKTKVDVNRSFGARALVGVNATDRVSLYGHLGVTALAYDVTNGYTFAPPKTNSAGEISTGLSYGLGASYALDSGNEIFAEFTRVADVEFDGIPEVAGGTNRVNPNSLNQDTISVGYKFKF